MGSSKLFAGVFGHGLASLAALAGAAVSVRNYFDSDSGIQGTGGVQLVIAASLAVALLGLFAHDRRGAPRRLVATLALVLIAGTAFAAYLLESPTLLLLMGVCALGWIVQLVARRPSFG